MGFAHVDINNFFASCERAFRPELSDVPVAVLSNNDGCVIARSDQVKALGVPMGAPHFQWRTLFEREGVQLFSANFALYGDMSRRAGDVMRRFTPRIEVYSVDEAFLDLSEVANVDYERYCRDLIDQLQQWTCLPASVGFGPNKTLAKLATNWAKNNKAKTGCFAWADPSRPDFATIAAETQVGDIWGIGRRFNKKLQAMGVLTAAEFINLDVDVVHKKLGTTAARTHRELNGQTAIGFDTTPGPQKSMLVSRSFGQRLSYIGQLEPAVVNFASRLSWKLRQDDLLARKIGVFLQGDDRHQGKSVSLSGYVVLSSDSNSSQRLIEETAKILPQIFRPGVSYRRGGIWASELVDHNSGRVSVFKPEEDFSKQASLDKAVDAVNERYGKGLIRRGTEFGQDKPWKSSRKLVSPKYTISWADVPKIR